jgi:hypothetical protein
VEAFNVLKVVLKLILNLLMKVNPYIKETDKWKIKILIYSSNNKWIKTLCKLVQLKIKMETILIILIVMWLIA